MSSTQFGSNHIAISTWRGWLVAVASAANELRLNIQVLLAVLLAISANSKCYCYYLQRAFRNLPPSPAPQMYYRG